MERSVKKYENQKTFSYISISIIDNFFIVRDLLLRKILANNDIKYNFSVFTRMNGAGSSVIRTHASTIIGEHTLVANDDDLIKL